MSAFRRGEVFSPVGVRLPNPYENVHLCLEFAIYQTHVNLFLNLHLTAPNTKKNKINPVNLVSLSLEAGFCTRPIFFVCR